MGKKLDLNYFYGQESDQFNFIRIPKPLLYDPMYKDVRLEEVLTYSMLLDRMRLSMKNGWFDELGRAYVYCSIETVMEYASCGKNKAGDILKNLDAIGLIEKVLIPGRGLKIYVKNFIPKDAPKFENQTLEAPEMRVSGIEDNNREIVDNLEAARNLNDVVYISNDPVYKSTDQDPENKPGVVYFSNTNNNNLNNNNFSNNKSIHITSARKQPEPMRYDDDETAYANLIRENISLDILMERYPYDREILQGMYDLILETVLTSSETVIVASSKYSANFVRGKLLKLNSLHIEYVLENWKKNVNKPRNVKKYLLAALFNAPSTIDAFYQAEYNHDRAIGNI